tara:strand:+ start:360 stop:635 length:276 start_codon:yes stop_codon:yes gene_type:complete
MLTWISLVIPRDNKESINQSNQNSNIYINIIIKQLNQLHNQRTMINSKLQKLKELNDYLESLNKNMFDMSIKELKDLNKKLDYFNDSLKPF